MDVLRRDHPYRHALIASFLSKKGEKDALRALDAAAWENRVAEIYEFGYLADQETKAYLIKLINEESELPDKISELERIFECSLDPRFGLEIHRYTFGCGIGVHTDGGVAEVRAVISLNRKWERQMGGIWVISSSKYSDDRQLIPSLSNTGFVFSAGTDTWHGLSDNVGTVCFGLTVRFQRI